MAQGPLYSEELGLDLGSCREQDLFLWFLASLLFGQRISEVIAGNTYHSFVRRGLTTPQKIVAAGRAYLVNPVMREGGYVRYDDTKSTKILRDCAILLDLYGSSPQRMHDTARDKSELEARLLAFSGVGPVTMHIFLRKLRPHWGKADPAPLPFMRPLARRSGLHLDQYDRKSREFARVEAGLIRLRHLYRNRSSPRCQLGQAAWYQ